VPKDLIKKIKDQFKTTVPEDYELEFDICMKCGRRLEDKKLSTLRKHQEKNHPIVRKHKLKEIFFKYPVTSVVVLMVSAVIFFGYVLDPVLESVLIQLGVTMPEQIDTVKCSDDVRALKEQIYSSKGFTSEHTDEFNRLLTECNVNFFAVTREVPIYEQENYNPDKDFLSPVFEDGEEILNRPQNPEP